ncbi:head completion/stabilization protein [Providencia rettgeri]|uniref:head completion/stabilization protein n=1 Tax=Providencia sp. PROV060 TaxID=2949788 RepID=UPI002349A141|nr:head completion/stabilization protein [Providencia sp. PROV060]EJD6045554.1 head completion/stabilization protein [Providencia rettgeri]EJD6049623.1 head completion/stabilization protein [Providencia rettgeri]ELR5103425.1 head completion/stabilization protein [Providencia rettgeri]
MDFVSPEPANEKDETLTSGAFWPEINTRAFRESMRVDGTVTQSRLIEALKNAIIETNRELSSFQQQEIHLGYQTLEAVPANKITHGEIDVSELVILYRRAVFSAAKANLIERYRDIDTTPNGSKKADDLALNIDDLQRDAVWAIQRIKGTTHNIVELI